MNNKFHRYFNTILTIVLLMMWYFNTTEVKRIKTEVRVVETTVEQCEDKLFEKITGKKLTPEEKEEIDIERRSIFKRKG